MNNKEQLAEKITTGIGIGQYMDKSPRIANFLLGWDSCETYYKNIIIKFAEFTSNYYLTNTGWVEIIDINTPTSMRYTTEDLYKEFLKTLK